MGEKKEKPIYQELQTGKKDLRAFSIVILVISGLAFIGSAFLIIWGAIKFNEEIGRLLLCVIGGAVVLILAGIGICFGFLALFTSNAMINTKGSVKDGNRAIGTDNIVKCPKCGVKNKEGATYCKTCGEPLNASLICGKCGTANPMDAEFCDKCGNKLK